MAHRMMVYPPPSFNFVELEATIKFVLAEVESEDCDKSGLLECVMCSEVGSCQDVKRVLSHVLMLASCDENVLLELMLVEDGNEKLATNHPTEILVHLHPKNVTTKRQSPTIEHGTKHLECDKVEEM